MFTANSRPPNIESPGTPLPTPKQTGGNMGALDPLLSYHHLPAAQTPAPVGAYVLAVMGTVAFLLIQRLLPPLPSLTHPIDLSALELLSAFLRVLVLRHGRLPLVRAVHRRIRRGRGWRCSTRSSVPRVPSSASSDSGSDAEDLEHWSKAGSDISALRGASAQCLRRSLFLAGWKKYCQSTRRIPRCHSAERSASPGSHLTPSYIAALRALAGDSLKIRLEVATWLNTATLPISFFQSTWPVPPAPARRSIILFKDLENAAANVVISSVLQYGVTDAGGGVFWGVSHWYQAAAGILTFVQPIPVNPSAVLTNVISLSANNNPNFNYQVGGSSGFTVFNIPQLTRARRLGWRRTASWRRAITLLRRRRRLRRSTSSSRGLFCRQNEEKASGVTSDGEGRQTFAAWRPFHRCALRGDVNMA
ncbi:hypothetical protein C8J57DRAFT_1222712 [Mycena rebaudengoi]|nr:hypothetical protein C8J57DRAFT_1222712 [Mycena rebaudengoi]